MCMEGRARAGPGERPEEPGVVATAILREDLVSRPRGALPAGATLGIPFKPLLLGSLRGRCEEPASCSASSKCYFIPIARWGVLLQNQERGLDAADTRVGARGAGGGGLGLHAQELWLSGASPASLGTLGRLHVPLLPRLPGHCNTGTA